MIERTTRTQDDFFSKYVGQYQYEWTNFLPRAMMAYQSSVHFLTKRNNTATIRNFTSFYRGLYAIVEVINDLNSKMKDTKKVIKTKIAESQAKQKTSITDDKRLLEQLRR